MLATLVTVANAVVLDKRVFWGGAAITELGKSSSFVFVWAPYEVGEAVMYADVIFGTC